MRQALRRRTSGQGAIGPCLINPCGNPGQQALHPGVQHQPHVFGQIGHLGCQLDDQAFLGPAAAGIAGCFDPGIPVAHQALIARAFCGLQPVDLAAIAIDILLEQRAAKSLFRREVVVERTLGDVAGLQDFQQAQGSKAFAQHELVTGIEDVLAGRFRLLGQGHVLHCS